MLKLNSNILATWYEELTHWKRPWCWERLKEGGEGDNSGWDCWMASPTQWTGVWASFRSWWWTRRPGMPAVHGITKSWTWLSDWTDELMKEGVRDTRSAWAQKKGHWRWNRAGPYGAVPSTKAFPCPLFLVFFGKILHHLELPWIPYSRCKHLLIREVRECRNKGKAIKKLYCSDGTGSWWGYE